MPTQHPFTKILVELYGKVISKEWGVVGVVCVCY